MPSGVQDRAVDVIGGLDLDQRAGRVAELERQVLDRDRRELLGPRRVLLDQERPAELLARDRQLRAGTDEAHVVASSLIVSGPARVTVFSTFSVLICTCSVLENFTPGTSTVTAPRNAPP